MPKDKDGTSNGGDVRDYEVGYKRPPRPTQFQPGRLGNPAGRPKGLNNLRTDVKGMLEVPVTVTERGRKRKISTQRAALMLLREMTLHGNPKAQKLLVDLAKSFNNEHEQAVAAERGPNDQEILNAYRAKILGEVQSPEDPSADDCRGDTSDDAATTPAAPDQDSPQ